MSSASEDRIDVLRKLDLPVLESLRDGYAARNDRQAASDCRIAINRLEGSMQQTEELSRSGRLIQQRRTDPDTGRITHTFIGDPAVWMKPFMTPGMSCKIDTESFTGKNSPAAKAAKGALANGK